MESEAIKSIKLSSSLVRLRGIHDVNTAITELLDFNYFSVLGTSGGPYELLLDSADNKLFIHINGADDELKLPLPLRAFKTMVKDYFLLLDSYHAAIQSGHPEKIEALDMGRRSLHNEGAEKFINLLENKINVDFETARRFFTIIASILERLS
jgi:uncharacterized protein (UPF0262 family)